MPRGGRALVLGVALLLAAPTVGGWLRACLAAPVPTPVVAPAQPTTASTVAAPANH